VPIETEISAATAQFVRARVDRANRELPLALVFYLDTPGGQVSAMQRIVEDVLNRAQVPTLAIVRNAFSAGRAHRHGGGAGGDAARLLDRGRDADPGHARSGSRRSTRR
jgi:hypothetical protein